jgi:PEP-CTERM motif
VNPNGFGAPAFQLEGSEFNVLEDCVVGPGCELDPQLGRGSFSALAAAPEPASLALFGDGLAGLGLVRRTCRERPASRQIRWLTAH